LVLFLILFFVSQNIRGRIDIEPKRNLIPLKVKGPINSIPARWAVNAKPHIIAVKRRRKSFLSVLLFIFLIILHII